jgi:galactokinase
LDTTAVKRFFKQHFGYTPAHVACAPGRLELLGNHTDYNEGLVMSVAVDKYVCIAASPRTDGKIELVSSAFSQPDIFWISEIKHNPDAPWADYVKGVLVQLRKRGVHFSGFSAAIDSNVPVGVGMSSSAALEVASALIVRQLFAYSLTELGASIPPRRDPRGRLPPVEAKEKLHLARLCQAAEIEFVGVNCGLLDQISSLCGRSYQVMNIDCRFHTVDLTPLLGEAIVVCNSGVKHQLTGGEYNELRENCESAAQALGAKSLRSVELSWLKANRGNLNRRQYECAYHVVSEIQRVAYAGRALSEDDHRQFGQYMFLSHESSRDYLKNSCPELDLLVDLARAHPGCLGARLTGGGFGGATVNLVAYHQTEDFLRQMSEQYERRTGRKMKPMVCQIVDGAG